MNDKLIYIDKNNKLNLSNLREDQNAFIKSQKLHSGIVGGYQSGKSLSAAVKVITKLLINPNVPIAYYLPTYGLIDDMLVPKFDRLFNDINVPYNYHKKESKIITPYGEIWMRSMNEPDRIVSYSVGYSLVDEADIVHQNKRLDAMKRISSRNSYKKNTINSIDFVSTPEGFGYMYEFFVKKMNDNKILFNLKTQDNIENLGIGYIDGLKELYDTNQLRAYMGGEFVNLTSGTVYKNFDRFENSTTITEQPGELLHVGIDFNITKMSAVIHVIRNGIAYAVNELVDLYDTQSVVDSIKQKYSNHNIYCYPDASGRSRSTSGRSDVQILEQGGFKIFANAANPFIKDRVNAMNNMFRNSKTIKKYYVNTDRCPLYTEALEQLNYKNGEPDKSRGLDHVCDAGGYFISYRFPIIGKLFKTKWN